MDCSRKTDGLVVLAAALPLLACSVPVQDGTDVRFTSRRQASIAGQTRDSARLLAAIVREQAVAPEFRVQKLPTFDTADLELTNSTLLTGTATHSATMSATASQSLAVYSRLRPGDGYRLACTVKENGTRRGYGYSNNITLAPGPNWVTIIISVDGDIRVVSSGNKNAVGSSSDWIIVKDDTITFNTGFDAREDKTNAPASLKMQVILGQAIYDPGAAASADRKIAEVNAPGPFDQYQFATGTSAAPYDKDKLTVANGSTVTFRLVSGTMVVGESVLSPVRVIQGSHIDLRLQ